MSDSPPPNYSPPRPPPPYEEQNNQNLQKEGSQTYKISPPPFAPLTGPAPSQIDASTLHQVPLGAPNPTTIVIISDVKQAPSFSPYVTYCPKCAQNVTTKQNYVSGSLTWIVFILVLFFFFPLAFVPFCLDSCKDVQHYCPKCAQLLSIKKRFL